MIIDIYACLIVAVGVVCFFLGGISGRNSFILHGKKDADNDKDSNGSNGTDSDCTSDTARTNSSLILGEDHNIGKIAVKSLLDDERSDIIIIHKCGGHLKSTPLGADNPEVECVIYKDGMIYYSSDGGDLLSYDGDLCCFNMIDRAGHFSNYSEMLSYSVSDFNAEVGEITKIFTIDSFFCYEDEIDNPLYLLHKKFDYGESPFI